MAVPVIGGLGNIVLNSQAYYILASTYQDWAPRLRKATPRYDGQEGYVDLGLGKRLFKMTILALNDITNYDGTQCALTAIQVRAALDASYALVNQTMPYVDPAGIAWTVRFDHLLWKLPDPRTQVNPNGPAWHAEIELVQA